MASEGSSPPAAGADKHELIRKWESDELPLSERNALLGELMKAGKFPELWKATQELEDYAGLYPSVADPEFGERLIRHQEFAESRQESIKEQQEAGVNPCDPDQEFELTPVQRFVGRFMSPQCPYNSALLYHGVGVGKTCAAITIAENYLAMFPRRKVYIVAPRNIQPGFKRTIFDDEALKIDTADDMPNTAKGCTGNAYLRRTGMEFERDKPTILRRVAESIRSRYVFLGYIQFHRMVEEALKKIPKGLDDTQRRIREADIIRREFDGRLLIIDEAHNLRDNPGETEEENLDTPGGDLELTEAQAGRRLTPTLLKVLRYSQGLKFVALTGTPMYNSYREIVFLLNLLLINDKRVPISEKDIFNRDGSFVRPEDLEKADPESGRVLRGGKEILGAAAAAYVSFMRGENPLSFPVRLPPIYEDDPEAAGRSDLKRLKSWPSRSPNATELTETDRKPLFNTETGRTHLPFAPVVYEGAALDAYKKLAEEIVSGGGGIDLNTIDRLVQAGNWMFPDEAGVPNQPRDVGFNSVFQERFGAADAGEAEGRRVSRPVQYSAQRAGGAKWLVTAELAKASPKAALILKRVAKARGPVFVYSRFIKAGGLPLALALEANGYTSWSRDTPLLGDGIQDGLGRQCALCDRRERQHAGARHGAFVPAKYVLVTGNASISPNNPAAIQAARAKTNMDGRDVKIVIGSSVASEGVDFRFMREIYVFDSWFHLIKLEQVLGRGVRTCSHALLPNEGDLSRKNCSIHLLVNTFGEGEETETADLYMYRLAIAKAMLVGNVTRTLKEYALDCNLNRDAILITGLKKEKHIDSQGFIRPEVSVDDAPYTAMCDWLDDCEYECKATPGFKWDEVQIDSSTYDEYAVRWHETQLKRALRSMFEKEGMVSFSLPTIRKTMTEVPEPVLAALLSEIVDNQSFRLTIRGKEGYITYRNGRYLFQPLRLRDTRIPLALRIADVPVRQDFYEPSLRRAPVAAGEPGAAASGPVIQIAEEAPAEAAAVAAAAAAPLPMDIPVVVPYWNVIKAWAATIAEGTAHTEGEKPPAGAKAWPDLPSELVKEIKARYAGDEAKREEQRLLGVAWMYESIRGGATGHREVLAQALLEFIWDESLKPNEQHALLRGAPEGSLERRIGREQIQRQDAVEAFRYIDTQTGKIRYIFPDGKPNEALSKLLEASKSDPLYGIKADKESSGPVYGFLVPKAKEGRLVFKTSDSPPAPGGNPEKGGECAIVSTIALHIKAVKALARILEAEELPKFFFTDDVLDEKERRLKAREAAKKAGQAEPTFPPLNKNRTFENMGRACAIIDLTLRWLDITIERRSGGGAAAGGAPGVWRRFFYRPIAALRSKHKGTVAK